MDQYDRETLEYLQLKFGKVYYKLQEAEEKMIGD